MKDPTKRLKQHLRGIAASLPGAFPRTGRNFILGLAMHYRPEQLMPFVESIRACGYADDVVLLISAVPQATIDYLHSRNVRTVRFETHLMIPQHIALSRWVRFFELLMDYVDQRNFYDTILLTDTRDVVLQGTGIFIDSGYLDFHLEDPKMTIGGCPWNSKWIRLAYGETVLARYADRPISCVGTVSGSMRGIIHYLIVMQCAILDLPAIAAREFGGDQAVHNFIVHERLVPQARILENARQVATLQWVAGAELSADSAARVVNVDGSISDVVHQWDRHPHLAEPILGKYCPRPSAVQRAITALTGLLANKR